MKNRIPFYITIPLSLIVIGSVIAVVLDTDKYDGFLENPYYWMFMFVIALLLFAVDSINKLLDAVKLRNMSEERRAEIIASRKTGWAGFIQSITKSKSVEQEEDVLLEHDYDGIQELDNELPPWWVALFYITIAFSVIYLIRYYAMDGPTQAQEYEMEMTQAKAEVEEYLKNTPDLINFDNVELLTDASSLDKGREVFVKHCVACHTDDAGGMIGPNLTDEYWILGGGIKNVYKTISNGGRPDKGMISWKSTIRPTKIQQVASYILSLQGTSPKNPKAPEGEKWTE